MPPGSSVVLPADWLRGELLAEDDNDDGILGDLTLVQVADALDRSVSTIRTWCNSNRMVGAYKLGRSWRIPRAALDSLRNGPVEAPTPLSRDADLGAWRKARAG